jgi:hypothetical protein
MRRPVGTAAAVEPAGEASAINVGSAAARLRGRLEQEIEPSTAS